MSSARHDDGHWLQTPPRRQATGARRPAPRDAEAPGRDELYDPRTQIVSDRDDYLGQGRNDVGRRISSDQVELFITADVPGSLQREFMQHTPEFVALHDVGTSASLRLLGSLAGAAGAPVQRLSVRRQGHGVALAVLQFVEVPLADGTLMRIYSSDVAGDAQERAQLARVLLAHSRLGVLLVGALPLTVLTSRFAPLHEALLRGPWPNRDLLLLPLGTGTALATPAAQLASESPVHVHVAPHAGKPKDAWTFISGAWNRLHGKPGGERALQTDLALAVPKAPVPNSEAETVRMELSPDAGEHAAAYAATDVLPLAPQAPAVGSATPLPLPKPGATDWQCYADRCLQLKGALACCVFDVHSMQPLASAGSAPSAERMAQQGTALLRNIDTAARALRLGAGPAEAAITVGSHLLLLRPVPGYPGVALHLVLSAAIANPTLARLQLERVEAPA